MTQFSEQSASFTQDRGSRSELNAEEEAAVSAAREILFRHISRNPVLTSWAAVVDYCSFSVRGDVERFHVLYLDRKNRLISDERMGVGTVDHVPVYPREVIKRALILGASALILVHNHPSGDPTPSQADIQMTKAIIDIAAPLGISVHDHIIVGKNGHASLKGMRLI